MATQGTLTAGADVESSLREITGKCEGVEKVASMGRYSSAGVVYFSGPDPMWDFIKENKATKSDFDGVTDLVWLTIEKHITTGWWLAR